MKIATKTCTRTIAMKATPDEVYRALANAKEHAALTDSVVHMKPVVGSSFDAYDGYISGKTLSLKEEKKIVWLWRADEEGWPDDHFSRVVIELKKTKTGTEIHFTQTGVPAFLANVIADGWEEHYWRPLKRMLEM